MSLRDWAVRYSEMGWKVHPLRPGDKVPATPHGCKDATDDPDRVARWWARHPDHNIGLATGHAFDVLDLDGPDGETAFDDWWAATITYQAAPDPSGLLVVGTPGPGQHWYGPPTGAGNRAGVLSHVDWRGAGGYVVAPPSVHPNGGVYEWLNDPAEAALVPWPPQLVSLVLPAPLPHRPRWAPKRWEGTGHGTPYGIAGLEAEARELAGTGEGARNHQLFSSAVAVLELVAGGQVDEDVALLVLRHAAAHAGLGEAEVETTLASAQRHPVLPRRPV